MHKKTLFFALLIFLILVIFFFNSQRKEAPPSISNFAHLDNFEQIENFSLLDHQGNFHELYYYSDRSIIAISSYDPTETPTYNSLRHLEELAVKYNEQKILFLFLTSNKRVSRTQLEEQSKKLSFTQPILVDKTQLISHGLKLNSQETVLINPKNWALYFKGKTQDILSSKNTTNLELAIQSLLDNPLPNKPYSPPSPITSNSSRYAPLKTAHGTYTEDISPILKKHCLPCHHQGGAAPWAMNDYETIRSWGPMIREVVRTKQMPPYFYDSEHLPIESPTILSTEEEIKLIRWIETGMVYGAGTDPLKSFSYKKEKWPAGTPDKIHPLKLQKIPSKGIGKYRYVTIPEKIPEEGLWIKGAYFKFSNLQAAHHALLYNIEKQNIFQFLFSILRKTTFQAGKTQIVSGYVSGFEDIPVSDDIGYKIEPDSKLFAELHYVPIGKETTDKPELGIYYLNHKPTYQFRSIVVSKGPPYKIPPMDNHFEGRSSHTFTRDGRINAILLHMHLRGKSGRFELIRTNGEKETLLSVPRYSYLWQPVYRFKEDIPVQKGDKIQLTAFYDNSPQNLLNPNPHKTVKMGLHLKQEMLLFSVLFITKAE